MRDHHRGDLTRMKATADQLNEEVPVQPLVFAVSLCARLIGLLSSRVCPQGEVLVLVPCKSIHTFGMREALDVAFVDGAARVVASYRDLPPSRIRKHPEAKLVLERRASPKEPWFEAEHTISFCSASVPEKNRNPESRGNAVIERSKEFL